LALAKAEGREGRRGQLGKRRKKRLKGRPPSGGAFRERDTIIDQSRRKKHEREGRGRPGKRRGGPAKALWGGRGERRALRRIGSRPGRPFWKKEEKRALASGAARLKGGGGGTGGERKARAKGGSALREKARKKTVNRRLAIYGKKGVAAKREKKRE
jgi:hypothetical protein